MGERYAFGVDEPWKAWVAYAKAGWDTITRRGKLTKVEQIFCAKFERFFLRLVYFFPLRMMKIQITHTNEGLYIGEICQCCIE